MVVLSPGPKIVCWGYHDLRVREWNESEHGEVLGDDDGWPDNWPGPISYGGEELGEITDDDSGPGEGASASNASDWQSGYRV